LNNSEKQQAAEYVKRYQEIVVPEMERKKQEEAKEN